MRHGVRSAWPRLCVCGLLLAAAPAQAASPLDTSTLTLDGAAPPEGAVFTYTLVLRNTGDTVGALVEIAIPSAAMLVSVGGLTGATVDHETRVIRWEGPLTPGTSRTATVSLVAGLDAGGKMASLRATARPWQGESTYLAHAVQVDSVPTPSVFRVGPIGVTAVGATVLAWLATSVLLWMVLAVWRPLVAVWAPVAIMLPAGFLLYFIALGREDARIMALPTTTCTVLDRVIDSRAASSTTSASSSNTRRSAAQPVYAPRLALGYGDAAGPRVAQGFGTDSRLSGATAAAAETLLARYTVGAQVACAVDPRDPRRAYVERGYGGAYGFALIPLAVLALAGWGLTSRRRRGS